MPIVASRKWEGRAMAAKQLMLESMRMAETTGTCPSCTSGDLISITMTVSGRDLAFCTCHHCEAKWWYRDGEEVPLQSVIGLVVQK
jgi:DNA polymerase III alpha subunit (gram-positive type)